MSDKKIDLIEFYKDDGKWYRKVFYFNVLKPDVEKVKTPFTVYDNNGDVMIVLEDEVK